MSYYVAVDRSQNDFLQHYGVKGMKWGVRRYLDEQKKKRAKFKEEVNKFDKIAVKRTPVSYRIARAIYGKKGMYKIARAYNKSFARGYGRSYYEYGKFMVKALGGAALGYAIYNYASEPTYRNHVNGLVKNAISNIGNTPLKNAIPHGSLKNEGSPIYTTYKLSGLLNKGSY